jgi:hypothetical protein
MVYLLSWIFVYVVNYLTRGVNNSFSSEDPVLLLYLSLYRKAIWKVWIFIYHVFFKFVEILRAVIFLKSDKMRWHRFIGFTPLILLKQSYFVAFRNNWRAVFTFYFHFFEVSSAHSILCMRTIAWKLSF